MKQTERWYSNRLQQSITLTRWGHFGTPVLIFPTAGGDAEEIERMELLTPLLNWIEAGRIKVYSCDSVAGRAWVEQKQSPAHCSWLHNQFHEAVRHEILPAIHADCGGPIEPIVTGASIGAFNAVSVLCRYPDRFKAALGMSGSYDLERLFKFSGNEHWYFCSPLHFLPGLTDPATLDALRQRQILLTIGGGRWESPEDNWRLAELLGSKGIPNQVEVWGSEWDHDWPTWRAMLPLYLDRLL